MPRLIWSAPGTRTYEAGVDRGVLFPPTGPAVVWPGLISIDQINDSIDVDEYYFDGRKYSTSASPVEYKAKLTAFAAPKEFHPCEGNLALAQGLYVARQPRARFGLCYRTLVGNDLDGTDYGYKLHFVYNAVALPSAVAATTLSRNSTPNVRSWTIRSVPYNKREFVWFKESDGQYYERQKTRYAPVSHIVISSRSVVPETLELIEKVIYGTDTTDPELPTPVELIELMR